MGVITMNVHRDGSILRSADNHRVGLVSMASRVEIKDLLILIASVLAMFNYGSSWTGLTGSQLTTLRFLIALFACALVCFRVSWGELARYEKAGLVYCGLVFVEGLFGKVSPGSAWIEGMVGALLFTVPSELRRKYGNELSGTMICLIVCLLICVADAFAIATGGKGFVTQDNEYLFSSNYIIGSKFLLSYMNMLCFALIYWKIPSVVTLVVFGSISFWISALVGCSTGVTGTVIMIIMILLSYPVRALPTHRLFLPILTVVLAIVAVAFTGLLTWGPFGRFITNVLGESSDLTGRVFIYPVLIGLFVKRPLFGYLTANGANQAVIGACGSADAQEGLFHILLTNGLVGAVLFLIMEYLAIDRIHYMGRREHGLYAFIVAMTVCSVVEINLGLPFILGLSFLASSLEVCE